MPDEENEFQNQEDLDDIQDEDVVEDFIEPEEDPANVVFENGKGIVSSEDSDRLSQQGFYGTRIEGNRLELEPVELLHLIERKRVIVATSSGEQIGADYIVNELLVEDPDLWIR